MDPHFIALILFLCIAVLYSSVGHGGASAYLAIMALLSFAPETIRPSTLVLNAAVASIATWRYLRAGQFDRRVFIPVALAAIPMAFLGGMLQLPPRTFALIAGTFLVVSAILLGLRARKPEVSEGAVRPLPLKAALAMGLPIGLLSGIIGVGGGIFLSPILILGRWTTVRQASGIAALFILVNSLAGLAGALSKGIELDPFVPYWLLAVILGGFIGSHLGVSRLGTRIILAFLFVVLLSAGLKMLFVS